MDSHNNQKKIDFSRSPKRNTNMDGNKLLREVNINPYKVREQVHAMIRDQTIDSSQLTGYLFPFVHKKELTENTPENQNFWKDVEHNFIKTYLQETDDNLEFRIPIRAMNTYFMCVSKLNSEGQVEFGKLTSPMIHLLKRHFLRCTEMNKEDVSRYTNIIGIILQSKHLRKIFDNQVRDKIFSFFVAYVDDFDMQTFKKICYSIAYTKIWHNTDLARQFEAAFKKKFLEVYPEMELNDIVPIYRSIYRGPKFKFQAIDADFERFMLSNVNILENLESKIRLPNEFDKVLLYFEGCLYLQTFASENAKNLLNKTIDAILAIKDQLQLSHFTRMAQAIFSFDQRINYEPLKDYIADYLAANQGKLPKEIKTKIPILIQNASLGPHQIEKFFSPALSLGGNKENNQSEDQRVAQTQAEIFIKGVLDIEGKQLSEQSKKLIMNMIAEDMYGSLVYQISQSLINQGIDNEVMPEIWKQIGDKMLKLRTLTNSFFYKNLVVNLAKSKYSDARTWRELKEDIASSQQSLDLASYVALRNAFLINFPDDKAFLCFLEQRSISLIWKFGKLKVVLDIPPPRSFKPFQQPGAQDSMAQNIVRGFKKVVKNQI